MEGVISNFRSGRHTKHNSQMIVQVKGVTDSVKAKELLDKKVVWASPAKKELKGRVIATHGNKGAVRVKFETGIPGQAIGQKVSIS